MVKDEVGNRYERLTVVARAGSTKHKQAVWKCLCDCGAVVDVRGSNLRSGNTLSCGCFKREASASANTTHSRSYTKVYSVWKHMMSRCTDKNHSSYLNYGGRGIEVCEEWLDAEKFCIWAEENGWEEGKQIDRINNNLGYEPRNCRFVSHYENQHNKRRLTAANKSGYAGVRVLNSGNYNVAIRSKLLNDGKTVYLGTFFSMKTALRARNRYIHANNLPHRIQE